MIANTPGAPPVDDRPLWDSLLGMLACPALLVARDLGIFACLADAPRTAAEIAGAAKIAPRPAHAVLSLLTAIGVLEARGEHFALTAMSRAYLLPDSPTYFGGLLDMLAATYSVYTAEGVKKAVVANAPHAFGGDLFKSVDEHMAMARAMTRAMHSLSVAPAQVWPTVVDLSRGRQLLDIGGGSGAHAISAAQRWPELRATVFDLPFVCDVAREFVAAAGLTTRVGAHPGDFFADAFPPADVHFYSQIFHDWPAEKCAALARKSFASLPAGGTIVLHEMAYNEQKTGPRTVAALDVSMLLGTQGQQYSARELGAFLTDAGFVDVTSRATFGYWSATVGRRP